MTDIVVKLDGSQHHSEVKTGRVCPDDDVTGVRRVVLMRCRELGLHFNALSRACGRNDAFLHQFIYKKTPRRLHEDDRRCLAELLQVDEAMLRDAPLPNYIARAESSVQPPAPITTLRPAGAPQQVALFRECEQIAPADAHTWAPAFTASGGPATCAIWIDTPHGRLQAGDIAYVRSDTPARPGDLVVVLNGGQRICGLGELIALTADMAVVRSDSEPTQHLRSETRIMKVVGILLP